MLPTHPAPRHRGEPPPADGIANLPRPVAALSPGSSLVGPTSACETPHMFCPRTS